MSKDTLMSDEERRGKIAKLVTERISPLSKMEALDKLFDTQKRLYAESVKDIIKMSDTYEFADGTVFVKQVNMVKNDKYYSEQKALEARIDELNRVISAPNNEIWVQIDGLGHPSLTRVERLLSLQAQLTTNKSKE